MVSLLLSLLLHHGVSHAQGEPPRFQPPPIGTPEREDFDDEVEELDADGAPLRPPAPGGFNNQTPLPGQPLPPAQPPPSVRGNMNTFTTSDGKTNAIHFQVVEGEYFEKGKRRHRASDDQKPITKGSSAGPNGNWNQ